jgi:hypothetical protein
MMRFRSVFCALTVLLTSAAAAHARPEALSLEMETKDMEIVPDQPFSVFARIRNNSRLDQKIHLMACSYQDNWQVEGGTLSGGLPDACDENRVETDIIKPGEYYQRVLSLRYVHKPGVDQHITVVFTDSVSNIRLKSVPFNVSD